LEHVCTVARRYVWTAAIDILACIHSGIQTFQR
jgi:hypothetical protein